ncbi:hypothetical protein HPB50_009520 [Hyalomma asiaticum]|uniref:Uncharacterized protein n=1 Tax=Hyalomma asiaticum TaxID=266040 RepID=A0ACB7RHZ0_HYAAI|nr:hypothetical protein HPB50_009520 [Hyalomma asiaticum]
MLSFDVADLESYHVLCMAGGSRCRAFYGTLSELREHMQLCRSVDVECTKCQRFIASEVLVYHYRNCGDDTPSPYSLYDVPVRLAVEEIRGIKEDLQGLQLRALSERNRDDDLVNGANVLVERLSSLDLALTAAKDMTGTSNCDRLPAPSHGKRPATPGPFRAASKPGLFITACKFTNVYAARDSLTRDNKEHTLISDPYTLSGYTFKLQCKISLSEGKERADVRARFTLFLRSGEWDDFLEWPFSKKVALIISHPTDQTKDVRMVSRLEDRDMLKKPGPRALNLGYLTDETSWNNVELQGFIVRGALYVNVEFD